MDQKKIFELSDNSSYTTSSYAEFTVIVNILCFCLLNIILDVSVDVMIQ